ncbi:DUF6924 domain-containing protein [Streptomyces cucumeris]|uniref:DUF6924 domain-containing protein n=1 Tax=Streptomyces cucumeris TaxID=2962890 RepID=UPI003D716719
MKCNETFHIHLHTLEGVRDHWLEHGFATGPADRGEAEAGVADAYRAAGLEPPTTFIWLDSPMAGAIGAWLLAGAEDPQPQVEAGVRGPVEALVRAQIRGWAEAEAEADQPVWAGIRDHVGEQVRDRVRDQIPDHVVHQARALLQEEFGAGIEAMDEDEVWVHFWDRAQCRKFGEQIRDLVRAQVRDRFGAEIPRSISGHHGAEWLAIWDYFRCHWSVAEADRLAGIMRVARSAGRWWPFEHAVILTERSTVLHRDEQGRPHCERGPAIAYRDGFAVWAWHGVRLPRDQSPTRPAISRVGRDFETEALVVRTDHSDDEAWRSVLALLSRPEGELEVHTQIVDDRAFSGAGPDEVALSTLAGDQGLEVVFLADAATMKGDHSLLAVSTRCEELDDEDDGDNAEELGREFRLLPSLVHLTHVNLAIGHSDFWGFAYEAAQAPDNTLRW